MAIYEKHGVYAILPGDLIGRCAVIDPLTGCVDRVIMADDELDVVEGMILKNDPFVNIGDICNFKTMTFRKPLRLVSSHKKFMTATSLQLAA